MATLIGQLGAKYGVYPGQTATSGLFVGAAGELYDEQGRPVVPVAVQEPKHWSFSHDVLPALPAAVELAAAALPFVAGGPTMVGPTMVGVQSIGWWDSRFDYGQVGDGGGYEYWGSYPGEYQHRRRWPVNGGNGGNGQLPNPGNFPYGGFHPQAAMSQGYSPNALYLTHDIYGRAAPPGHAFDAASGQLVQLPAPQDPTHAQVSTGWNESFSNPDYAARMQGQSTIEQTPQGPVVVKQSDYIKHEGDEIPLEDLGITAQVDVFVNQIAGPARTKYKLAKSLIGYISVPNPEEVYNLTDPNVTLASNSSPLQAPWIQADGTHPPVGGCVAIANLKFGHQGVQYSLWHDVPQGTVVRVPFGGSFGRYNAQLEPKYWHNDDGVLVANTRVYLITAGGTQLTNTFWNNLPPNIVQQQNNIDTKGVVQFQAYFAKSNFPNTTLSQPIRRFYGSVKCTGVVAAQPTRCPIAWYANQVKLIMGHYSIATAGMPLFQFIINGQAGTGGVVETWGPFDVNEEVQLPVGATSIDVINSPNAIGGAFPIEVPFELDYTISI